MISIFSKQSHAVLKVNTSLEVHASKIYTRTMFEMFGRVLYVDGYYDVEEIETRRKYAAIHGNPELRDPSGSRIGMRLLYLKIKQSTLVSVEDMNTWE